MERAAEDATLGALGFAGICRETLRVIRSCPPVFHIVRRIVIMLSLSLLAHVAVSRVLFSHAVAAASDASGAGFFRHAANWAPFLLGEVSLFPVIHFLALESASVCVFSVAPGYSGFAADADRDARSIARDLRGVPRSKAKRFVSLSPGHALLAARFVRTDFAADARLAATSRVAVLLLLGYTALFGSAAVLMQVRVPRAALLLVGGTAYLARAAYIGAVWHVACVLSVMEEGGAGGFRAMHRIDELLAGAGKFWAAATVFAGLDGCVLALQLAFGALVLDARMGLGVWLRVAVGAVMAAALWATVVAGLVAQVVVYFVCKSNRGRCQSSDGTAPNSLTDVGRKGRATRNRKSQ